MKNPRSFAYWGLVVPFQLYAGHPQADVHLELSSLNRPNPFIDEENSTSSGNYNLTNNFFLHLHPQAFARAKNDHLFWVKEHELRVMDNTFGAAARIALFGAPDLVFLKGEKVFDRTTTKNLPNMKVVKKEKWEE